MWGSLPVVRVARQYRGRPIELLGQHDADQLVRPGEGGEAQRQVGFAHEGGIETVSAADDEADGRAAVVAPAGQLPSEGGRRHGLAVLVERDPDAFGESGAEGGGLVSLAAFGGRGT